MVEVHSSVKSICLNTFFMLVENAIFLVELLLRCISTVPSVFHVGSALLLFGGGYHHPWGREITRQLLGAIY